MFNLKSLAIAVAISASALVSTVPSADARQKVVVIEQSDRGHHARDHRRDRPTARELRAHRRAEARRAEARRDRRHDRRHERRHDRRNGSTVVVKIR
jgi:hypothetical protein